MIERLFDRTKIMEKALDASWLRNDVTAQNIANVDTPGYKRKTVSFEDVLSQSMDNTAIKGFRTDARHIPIGRSDIDDVEPGIYEDNNALSERLDGNNVDIENEMASMAKNTIKYDTVTQSLNNEFRRMRSVINGGGK